MPTAQAYNFHPVRIVAGGYIPSLIAHPTEPGLLYARTDIGSVYRWDSGSSQWIPLTDFHSASEYNLNGPESIALDPTDPDRLYIAAGMYTYSGAPYAMLVSTNRGKSFRTYPVPFSMGANLDGRSAGERLAVNPFQPSHLLMGTRADGLWQSSDHAQTWTKVSTFPVTSSNDGFGVQWVLFDSRTQGLVYAGSYTGAKIYVSSDSGSTWNTIPNQPSTWPFAVNAGTKPPAPEKAIINPDGNLYVLFDDLPGPYSMNYGLVEKYNPRTQAWTNITPPPDSGQSPRGGFAGLTQDPTRPGAVAVSTFARWYPVDTVYLSHDGGASWIDLAKVTDTAGETGPPYGNYYFNPPVFQPISPWLSFGSTAKIQTAKFGWWMSALLIDPSNPDHLLFATGATVYATNNVSAADSGTAPTWYVQASGIEETAVLALISPSQGAHLISGMGDIGGFRHDDLNVSPQAGMFNNPVATTTLSLDWAGANPSVITRTQSPGSAQTKPCTYAALSTDGGTSWNPFPTCAAGVSTNGAGSMVVDASGKNFVWSTYGSGTNAQVPQFSPDNGQTWTNSMGLTAQANVFADKVVKDTFYAFDQNRIYRSQDGGATFTAISSGALPSVGSCNGASCGRITANPAKAGDLWLTLGSNGLFHSIDAGQTWTALPNVSQGNAVAVGAAAPGSSAQSIFLYGTAQPLGVNALYRSDNNGATWLRIDDDQHQYGGLDVLTADPNIYGRVYFGMNGRGIIYGDIAK